MAKRYVMRTLANGLFLTCLRNAQQVHNLVAPLDSQPIKLEATIAALPSQEELVMLVELLR